MIEINNKTRTKINLRLVKIITENFFVYYKIKNKNVSIVFVGDIVMTRLNKKYRCKNYPTDILSFQDDEGDLGEIIIDYAQIKRQAFKFSKSIKAELIFILVHGLLHLLGYEDESEKGRMNMENLGKEFISQLKIND